MFRLNFFNPIRHQRIGIVEPQNADKKLVLTRLLTAPTKRIAMLDSEKTCSEWVDLESAMSNVSDITMSENSADDDSQCVSELTDNGDYPILEVEEELKDDSAQVVKKLNRRVLETSPNDVVEFFAELSGKSSERSFDSLSFIRLPPVDSSSVKSVTFYSPTIYINPLLQDEVDFTSKNSNSP